MEVDEALAVDAPLGAGEFSLAPYPARAWL